MQRIVQGLKLLFGCLAWPIGLTIYIFPSPDSRLRLSSRLVATVLCICGIVDEVAVVYLIVTEHFWWAVLAIVLYVVLTVIVGIFALLCDIVEKGRGAFA